MSSRPWRTLLAACALVAAAWVVAVAARIDGALPPASFGTLLADFSPRDVDGSRRIVQLDARSPLAAAGAQAGDRVRFDHQGDRWRRLRTGDVVGMTLVAARGTQHVDVRAIADPAAMAEPVATALDYVLGTIVAAVALLIGVLIGWRQREPGPQRVLAMVCIAGSMILTEFDVPAPRWYFDHVALPLRTALYWTVFTGFAYFCLASPAGASLWSRAWARRAFFAFAVAFGLYGLAIALASFAAFPAWASERLSALWIVPQLAALAQCAAGLWVGWRSSRGVARERVAWVGLSIGTVLVASTLGIVLPAVGLPMSDLHVGLLQGAVMLACVGGLGYAVLRGRVLDSGFALNRAVVYAVFAAMMLATAWLAIAIGERLVLVAGAQPRAPLFNVALAGVLVGLWSPYRAAAERGVLALLYPRWRSVDAALTAAIERAGQLTGREAILAHSLAALRDYAGGAPAAFYERHGEALVRAAGAYDAAPSAIALDAETLDGVHAARTPASLVARLGENALVAPIVHRDRLTGLVVVGGRPDFHAYRPDEARRIRHAVALLGDDLRGDAQRNAQALLEAKMAAEQSARVAAERLRDAQRELVRRFATPEVATDLETQGFALGGKRLQATTLFCDIRGFTALAERAGPEQTIAMLNGYYACMFEASARHGGVVNQIVGDGLMAIFGAPVPLADAPGGALRAAAEMLALLDDYNAARAREGAPALRIGIGIASGEVVAGYTGTEQRATYTCVGDTVNLAARLEAMTKELQQPVLVDGATRAAVSDTTFAFAALGSHGVRGRSGRVEVFAMEVQAERRPDASGASAERETTGSAMTRPE